MNAGLVVAIATGMFIAAIGPINSVLQDRLGTWGMVTLVHLIGLLAAAAGFLLFERNLLVEGRLGPGLRLLGWGVWTMLVLGVVWLAAAPLRGLPPYAFLGGVLGVAVVAGTILAIQHLGVLAALTVIVASQLLTAALIDQFGWFGQMQITMTPARTAGLLLVLLGVVLMMRET